MIRAMFLLLATAAPAMAQAPRDPASVALPRALELELKLRGEAVIDRFGAAYDRLGGGGAIPVIGPGSALAIRAAADRARVFLAYTQYDLDGDGRIGRSEFDHHAEIAWGGTLGAREYAILDREWEAADGNGDNVLTLGEIHALALDMHPVPEIGPPGEEGEMLLTMDLDEDGYVGWDEIEAVLRARIDG